MTKRRQFQYFRDWGSTLKDISRIMKVSIITAKRWNKELKSNTLIREHGLKNKRSNFSSMNCNKLLNDYLDLAKEISKDNRADPYKFIYYVEFKLKDKCSLSIFRNIMKKTISLLIEQIEKLKSFITKYLRMKKRIKFYQKQELSKLKQ